MALACAGWSLVEDETVTRFSSRRTAGADNTWQLQHEFLGVYELVGNQVLHQRLRNDFMVTVSGTLIESGDWSSISRSYGRVHLLHLMHFGNYSQNLNGIAMALAGR